MNSTKRPNSEAIELSNSKRAARSDCREADFNILIELEELEMAQVAGGMEYTPFDARR